MKKILLTLTILATSGGLFAGHGDGAGAALGLVGGMVIGSAMARPREKTVIIERPTIEPARASRLEELVHENILLQGENNTLRKENNELREDNSRLRSELKKARRQRR